MNSFLLICSFVFSHRITATPVLDHGLAVHYVLPIERSFTPVVTLNCNDIINQILKGVQDYPQYASEVLAIGKTAGLPSFFTFSVCKTFNVEAVDCTYAGLSVATGISLAIANGFIDTNPSSSGATQATPTTKRMDWLHSQLEGHLHSRGAQYDSITIESILERRDDHVADGDLSVTGHLVQIRGVHEPGYIGAADFQLGARDVGEGSVQVSPISADPLRKRNTGGFKISWKVAGRTGTPPAGARTALAQAVVDDWKSRAAANHDMVDYISMIDFQDFGRIQVRIMPESAGFGLDYEDVGTCSS
ncbi:hypothetical protein AB5N19_10003 [Seiridium cardinale]